MTPPRPTIVVTGLGAVTPLGWTLPETYRRLCAGESAIREVPHLAAAKFPVTIGAQVPDLERLLDRHPEARAHDSRKLAYFAEAFEEARRQAGIEDFSPYRCGVFLGVETSRIPFERSFRIEHHTAGPDHRVNLEFFGRYICRDTAHLPLLVSLMKFPTALPARIARRHGIRGPILATSNACSSANFAIGEALRRLRAGRLDMAVVGSADDMIDEYMVTGFSLLGALAQGGGDPARACRPFDCHRTGFVLGEAGAALVLETLDHARARGAKPLCELAGYGASSDGEKITACHPRGSGLRGAMAASLADAGLAPADIQYVNAHATSTRLNDLAESLAIKDLFGDHAKRLKVNATKSMIGHSVAAAGAVEAAVTVMTLMKGVVHPTLNLEHPDPGCDLDYCPGRAKRVKVTAAISNSCGFSGGNTCLAFRKL